MSKGVFTHPVYACSFCIAVYFPSNYINSFMSMETYIITLKTQCNAETACVNGMWQRPFTHSAFILNSASAWIKITSRT